MTFANVAEMLAFIKRQQLGESSLGTQAGAMTHSSPLT